VSIQSELLALKDEDGFIKAETVVAWARSHPKSALHQAPEFCGWNEKKLAAEHLLWAARRLIALHIVREDGERKFVSLTIDRTRPGGGYRDVYDVVHDKSLYELMLQDALAELQRLQLKYEKLKELKPLWRVSEKLRKRHPKKGGSPTRALSNAELSVEPRSKASKA
jgi:hypothetical protein